MDKKMYFNINTHKINVDMWLIQMKNSNRFSVRLASPSLIMYIIDLNIVYDPLSIWDHVILKTIPGY
jgi:hypothetical protein